MYLARRNPPPTDPAAPPVVVPRGWRRFLVDPNVASLGLTSLVTDVSSEMVASVLPLYLTVRLGFTALQFGATDGLLGVATAVTALVGALLADRWRRYREVAAGGYGFSAASRIGLVASTGWLPTLGWLGADRLGKGIRTGPRDALISLSAPQGRLGEAFGLHRMFDTGGALLGPILAVVLLTLAPGSYQTVFVASFFIALIGLAILWLLVENRGVIRRGAADAKTRLLSPVVSLWSHRRFRRVLLATALLNLPAVSDSFLFLTLERRVVLNQRWFPALFTIEAVLYLLLAVPFGRLADRIGAGKVLLIGQAALAASYVLLIGFPTEATLVIGVPVCLGLFFAATDGVLAALASDVVPTGARTTGLAVLGVVVAGGRAIAATGYGAIWLRSGPVTAVTDALIGLLVTAAAAIVVLRPLMSPRSGPPVPPPPTSLAAAAPVVVISPPEQSLAPSPAVAAMPLSPAVAAMPLSPAVAALAVSPAVAASPEEPSAVEPPGVPSVVPEIALEATTPPRRMGPRVLAFVLVTAGCLAGVVGVVVYSAERTSAASRASSAHLAETGNPGAQESGNAAPVLSPALRTVLSRPHLLVIDTDEGNNFERLEAVPEANPTGPEVPTPLVCERVDYRAGRGLCLTNNRVTVQYGITIFDDDFRVVATLPLAGLPSRTRVAPNGKIGAATSFVAGDAYNVDNFSTRTVLIDLVDNKIIADLETFKVTKGGHDFHPIDENLWGVTFAADSNTFYATMRTGSHYYLVRGDVRKRRMVVLRDDVECPSISPDGTRLVYKSRISHGFDPDTWRLNVLDLATLKNTPLAEVRSVDDQVAWLNNNTVLYGVAETGLDNGVIDTWKVPANGGGQSTLAVPGGESPVVVPAPAM